MKKIVDNEEPSDVVWLSVLHEVWPPNLDDVDEGDGDGDSGQDGAHKGPVFDPHVPMRPKGIH